MSQKFKIGELVYKRNANQLNSYRVASCWASRGPYGESYGYELWELSGSPQGCETPGVLSQPFREGRRPLHVDETEIMSVEDITESLRDIAPEIPAPKFHILQPVRTSGPFYLSGSVHRIQLATTRDGVYYYEYSLLLDPDPLTGRHQHVTSVPEDELLPRELDDKPDPEPTFEDMEREVHAMGQTGVDAPDPGAEREV